MKTSTSTRRLLGISAACGVLALLLSSAQALVVTNTPDGLRSSLFGWRNALIQPRGFHVLGKCPDPVLTNPSHP